MKKSIYVLLLSACLLFAGCQISPEKKALLWSGAWENEVHFHGTYSLEMIMDGENLESYGGKGNISGTIVLQKYDGTVLLNSDVAGSWENKSDYLNITIISDNENMEMVFIPHIRASSLHDNISMIGTYILDGVHGTCYTQGDSYSSPDVTHVTIINSSYSFGDSTYTKTGSTQYLYATFRNGESVGIARVDIQDGLVTDCPLLSGLIPFSLARDGGFLWIVGKMDADEEFFSLFKFPLSSLEEPEPGYPVTLSGHGGMRLTSFSISHSGTDLYYHNNDFFGPEVGKVNGIDGVCSSIIPGSMGNMLMRTGSLAAYQEGFYTSYFAPGGTWSEIIQYSASGSYTGSFCPPVNTTASLALDESIMYLIQGNRLYTILLQ